ncbi:MAG: alpha/beta hydrolase [Rhodobacteraceae bacterium]|nr:alpha/beta hydrolase [Paracoccaceae bacterium]
MPRGYVNGPFGQLHYLDTANDGIPLVLWPQAPMTLRQFDAVYDLFAAKGLRAIGIDPPGFGESDPPGIVPRIEDWATCIPAVLDSLGLDRAVIAGHHTGAMVAAEVAASHPERAIALIMHGTLLPTDEERSQRLAHFDAHERQFKYKSDGSHLTHTFAVRSNLSHGKANAQLLTRYVTEQFMGRGPFWHGHHAAYLYDLAAAIPKLTLPTLLISNTGDVIHNQIEGFRRLKPEVKYVELTGGGVDIVDEQPKAWVGAICEFVNAL